MVVFNSILVFGYLYIFFKLRAHAYEFKKNNRIAKYKQALKSSNEVKLFFGSILQLLIVEIFHTALITLHVIDLDD